MNEIQELSITPSLMIEYLYCPRFIYFMEVAKISQEEDSRYKVKVGREIHKEKALSNVDYKRKKIEVIEKKSEQELFSSKLGIHGKMDEILFLENGKGAILDYKFAKFEDKIYDTYKTQLLMYALLVEEKFSLEVEKGYLVYTRSKNHLVEIEFSEKDKLNFFKDLKELKEIINKGYFPKGTKSKSKCIDCCYENICIK